MAQAMHHKSSMTIKQKKDSIKRSYCTKVIQRYIQYRTDGIHEYLLHNDENLYSLLWMDQVKRSLDESLKFDRNY